ncbi:MAG: Methyltransferase type 11 [Deltaproteobacteria bacterium]|nr:Methyltransferase type 11 [Deltaproteobacteria bacterium]
MRESIRQLVKIVADSFPVEEPIYEFGALQLPGFEDFADLRSFFKEKSYVGCDMREGRGVDKVLNLHNIDVPDGSVGTVITCDTLEHVEFPHTALTEIHRILKPGGMVFLSTVLDFRIHDSPADYWRFTPDGLKSLLKPFSFVFVGSVGRESFPHTVIAIGVKGSKNANLSLDLFLPKFEQWKKAWKNPKGKSLKDTLYLFVPPILLGLDRRIAKLFKKT